MNIPTDEFKVTYAIKQRKHFVEATAHFQCAVDTPINELIEMAFNEYANKSLAYRSTRGLKGKARAYTLDAQLSAICFTLNDLASSARAELAETQYKNANCCADWQALFEERLCPPKGHTPELGQSGCIYVHVDGYNYEVTYRPHAIGCYESDHFEVRHMSKNDDYLNAPCPVSKTGYASFYIPMQQVNAMQNMKQAAIELIQQNQTVIADELAQLSLF